MGRNIIIFSDGTGQGSGIHFDERRSNIYKMYRAMRCGPDSSIDPNEQAAFYDPGLGSELDGASHYRGPLRWLYQFVSQSTGFGITANIVDCYAALIRLWRPGDRIFLFGFSRGAYTVRCLAGVIRQCGIPTRMPDGSPVPLDGYSTRKLAAYAVKHVYQFTTSRNRERADARQRFLLDTRSAIAARFRAEHGSQDPELPDRPNVVPYFIGVFDTVASLIDPAKLAMFIPAVLVAIFAVARVGVWACGLSLAGALLISTLIAIVIAAIAFVYTHLKFDFRIPGYDCRDTFRTIHFTDLFLTFDDKTLDPYVAYAKHALSIDENRKPFARVKWNPSDKPILGERDEEGRIRFEQIWFSGVHSDIGGSYEEQESRLSDIALKWMLECAMHVPNGLKCDPSLLRTYPDPHGYQHDARKDGIPWVTRQFGFTYPLGRRDPTPDAILHPSVYDRFDAGGVPIYDRIERYRPAALAEHIDVAHLYLETKSTEQQKAARSQAWAPSNPAPRPTPRKIYPPRPKARKVRQRDGGQLRRSK